VNSHASYGILDGETISELDGDLFEHTLTGEQRRLGDVQLLTPCAPGKLLAVGRNYKSHLETRPSPARPEIFYKPISSLQHPDGPIILPPDAVNAHFEGELVLVMGRRLRHAPREQAAAAIFGVTCGNDVSERNWQNGPDKDIQWWRAKGSDTFSPLGPVIATGLDYGNLRLTTRANGQVAQDQNTADLIFDCPTVVSFISQYVTLEPGDVIYTGTPGSTRKMNPGDTIEVEIEGIGVLRNPVIAEA
jgi:2-keto-4-pentenoate hydratase/2-oxohepta-3-ene-1,7-dioic acid hydratase in catechol pathway